MARNMFRKATPGALQANQRCVTAAGVHQKNGSALAHVGRQDRGQQIYDPRKQLIIVPRALLPDHVHVPGGPGPTVQANREL